MKTQWLKLQLKHNNNDDDNRKFEIDEAKMKVFDVLRMMHFIKNIQTSLGDSGEKDSGQFLRNSTLPQNKRGSKSRSVISGTPWLFNRYR